MTYAQTSPPRGDLSRFIEPLKWIPADDRKNWLKVGMALHHEGGGSIEARQMWDDWSATSSKFSEAEQRKAWKSFEGTKGITGGTIMKLAKANGYAGGSKALRSPGEQQSRSWADAERALADRGYRVEAVYPYCDARGTVVAEKVRLTNAEAKREFRWRHTEGGERLTTKGGRALPPYGLQRMLEHADQAVYIVEGEKDADRLNSEGLVAVSIDQGHEAEAARHLAGRTVYILPDNDEAGETRATAVQKAIVGHADAVRTVRLPDLLDKGDVSDWLDAGRSVGDLVRECEQAASDETNAALAGVTWSDDLAFAPTARHLIHNVLPATGIGFLYGESYTGKSFVAHELAMSVARGVPFAGDHKTHQGVAIYVALEDEAGMTDRGIAYRSAHQINGAPFAFLSYPLDLGDSGSVDGLIAKLKSIAQKAGSPIKLVVIDTLAMAMGRLDENNARDSAAALKAMKRIDEATQGCVLAVHHAGKNVSAGLRGHSALFAGADFVLRVDKLRNAGPNNEEHEQLRRLSVEKLKNGTPRKVGAFLIVPRPIGTDADGTPFEAGVLTWSGDAGTEIKREKLTDKQTAVLNHLDRLKAETAPERLFIDGAERDVWLLADLFNSCNRAGDVTDAEQPRSAKEAIRRQINGLQSKKRLTIVDGKVW